MKYRPFSVAISVYKNDNPAFFNRALESITVNQTIKPSEIVLVVDGPVPNEINEIIEKYSNNFNFKTIRLETNGGLGNALKIATENCSNELIARMDSDDVAVVNRFEQQLDYLDNHHNVDILGGNISEFIDDETNIVSFRNVPSSDVEIKKYIKKRCPFNHMTVMFKKSSVIDAGGYLDWHYNEDYFLWIRMFLNRSVFANLPDVLVNVRTGKDQFARRGGFKYFRSEMELQRYMFHHKMIIFPRYCFNVIVRFFLQVIMPNKVRGIIFRRVIRRKDL